uniref:constitutive coactivator of peroxisome proliferator-activated receptor gamma isoform X2 n=1 Tax=Myodes glareolus TaxID=447135 RepID=UPI0020211F5D|nr:constitutive coactivator of peroxisome proliferator-activated receptor gamma isoform X2 [Myodes glareolus]XP_048277608.1 constitutive coactivator of peroxisome proliferator-activated receptor gamma isoform X2 [Myodes glareolus]
MGVRGLQGFVGSTCPHICTVVNIQELAERHRTEYPGCTPTIVVDAMCCLRYWYTPESWICGGQWREYFSALRDFVAAFTSAGIKLIFFFDGMVEPGKREEWAKRRLKNNREIAKIFHYIKSKREQPGRNMFFIPSGLAIFTRFALKTLGQETFCSLQEADYEVASYGLQHNCLGILGEDTDYLIYDTCPYFSIGDLCLETLETIMLCREKLCESLGLHVADLPLLACLLGNDITPEGMFESFRYKCLSSYASVKENAGKKGNIILAVSDYISRVLHLYQGEKKIEDMLPLGPNKALFYKGVAAYLLPGQKSPWLVQKPKGIVTDKQVENPESKQEIPMCLDPESKQEVPVHTNPESMQEVPMCTDPESNQEASMCTDPESKQEVPMCTDPESKQEVSVYTYPEVKQKLPSETGAEFNSEELMCTHPEVKQEDVMDMEPEIKQVTMVSDSGILKVARMQHVHSESYLVYNIMSTGEIECSNTLEDELDQALPSQAFIYRPVRQRVYSLLLRDWKDGASTEPVVKEWFVYPGNSLKHPDLVRPLQVTVQGGTPSLEVLWLSQEPAAQARRLDTLLACFNLSSSREDLQAVESPLRALCCLLIYIFVQVDTLSLEDLHAFIAQALCLQGKSTSQLMNLQLDYINSRAVQLGSLLVRGLTMLILVNSACGFPWTTSEFMPWNVFDGKLFHQKYLQSEKGYAVEVLLEQNRSWLTKFHNLKAVVCKACSKENRRIVGRSHWNSHYTGRLGRQGSSSHRTGSTHGHPGQGQPWRDQGPGGRQYEHDQWRRY